MPERSRKFAKFCVIGAVIAVGAASLIFTWRSEPIEPGIDGRYYGEIVWQLNSKTITVVNGEKYIVILFVNTKDVAPSVITWGSIRRTGPDRYTICDKGGPNEEEIPAIRNGTDFFVHEEIYNARGWRIHEEGFIRINGESYGRFWSKIK